MGMIILILLLLLYFFFWMWQFVQLMLLSDDAFPGRNDKVLWVVTFIVFFLFAPTVFCWWKLSTLHVRDIEKNS